MKKRIQIIIISLLLLLLAGCDDILNSAYPSFDPDSTVDYFGSNSIDATLEIDSFSIDVRDSNIKLVLAPMNDGEIDFSSIWTIEYWGESSIYEYFDMLPDKAYRVFAYQDINDDGKPNFNEPSTELWDENSHNQLKLFDFRFDNDPTLYNAYGYLSSYSRIEELWLEKFNEGQDVGDYIDPNYWISGPAILNPGSLQTETFIIEQYDTAAHISNIEFKLLNSLGSEILFPSFATSIDWNNNEIMIDFANSYTLFEQGDSIRLETNVTVITNNEEYSIPYIFYINFDNVDPGFYISGISSLSKSSDFDDYVNYNIVSNGLTVDSFDWRITDSFGYDVYYNGDSGFNYENGDQLSINLYNLNPQLNDSWWTDEYLIIHIIVYYTNGDFYQDEFHIALTF